MKKYENESLFVNNFAKDCKESLKNGQNFEAEVNGKVIVVANMDNNNSSKVTIYSCTLDGTEFKGSITALKKRLNITYTKEYNRSGERATRANTKVVIKDNDELAATAKTAAERIKTAVNVLKIAVSKYGLTRAELLEHTDSVEAVILETLIQQRDAELARREAEALKREEEVLKKERQKIRLLEALSCAAGNGDYAKITQLTKELKQYM